MRRLALLHQGRLGCPAAAAAGAGRLFGSSAGSSDAHDAHDEAQCLYEVLGAKQSGTPAELKAAFRSKARLLHPDASPAAGAQPDRDAFVRCLHAYQVLANPRTRYLYELSRDRAGPRVLRAAAASGVQGAAGAAYDEVEVDLSWGLGSMFKQPPEGASAALDRVRQDLQGELHSAVRRAYLGPKLEELDAGHLPDAFEADERADTDCPDLLQLVSGRQLLGAVQERRLELLARHAAAAAALREGQQAAAAAVAGALPQPLEPEQQVAAAQGGRERAQGAPPAGMHAAASPAWEQELQGGSSSEQEGQPREQPQKQRQRRRDPDVLDLILGEGRVVASAVRHFPQKQQRPLQPQPGSNTGGHVPNIGGGCDSGVSNAEPAPGAGKADGGGEQAAAAAPPSQVILIYNEGRELLAQVEEQQLDPGSATASSARLLNADGRHTHTVYRTQTPLVRHLTFTAEQAGTGIRTRRPSRLVVCRARRAWLPPSSLWLFKPLSYSHDIGGWYLEWAGDAQKGHPAWLPPAVFVLTAAFDSLDHERAARQPLGLFGRVRAAAAAAATEDEAQREASQEQGWRGWLGSWKRFHGCRP